MNTLTITEMGQQIYTDKGWMSEGEWPNCVAEENIDAKSWASWNN